MGAGLAFSSRFFRGSFRLALLAVVLAPFLAACGGSGGIGHSGVKRSAFTSKEFGVAVSPRVTAAKFPPRGGGRELPLKPYVVAGKTYSPVAGPGYVERGKASWYGHDFHGRRTANGEIFGAFYFTAASPVLPIPSYARVTNLQNGKSIMVRINDRGPYLQGRIIDLSYQAATALGYTQQGSADVEVRYVGPAPLQGDDTKMLAATYNRFTRYEQEQQTRFAMLDAQPPATQLATAARNAPIPQMRSRTPLTDVAFGYADTGAEAVSAAQAAAEALAEHGAGLQDWVNIADGEASTIEVRLGVFRNRDEALRVAESFALLGAVDESATSVDGSPATALSLVRMKPGVERADIIAMGRQLGLDGLIIY